MANEGSFSVWFPLEYYDEELRGKIKSLIEMQRVFLNGRRSYYEKDWIRFCKDRGAPYAKDLDFLHTEFRRKTYVRVWKLKDKFDPFSKVLTLRWVVPRWAMSPFLEKHRCYQYDKESERGFLSYQTTVADGLPRMMRRFQQTKDPLIGDLIALYRDSPGEALFVMSAGEIAWNWDPEEVSTWRLTKECFGKSKSTGLETMRSTRDITLDAVENALKPILGRVKRNPENQL